MDVCKTYVDMLRHIEKGFSNPRALNKRDIYGNWQAISTQELLSTIKYLALGLHHLGISPGDRIGILAISSPNWSIADIAIAMAGGITVPLFATIAEDNFLYEVHKTEVKMLFVDGDEQWNLFQSCQKHFNLGIALGEEYPAHKNIKSFRSIVEMGKVLDANQPELYLQLQQTIKPDSVTSVIFTSGSTGIPKGVELTQHNLIGGVEFDEFSWDVKRDRYLSVLPLEHVFGHCFNIWMLYHGVSIYYSHDHKHLRQICQEVRPTMIAVVPRLLEKVYDRIVEKIHTEKGIKHLLGKWAFLLANKQSQTFIRSLFFPLLDLLVYSKFRQALGGNIRMLISGGAPLGMRLNNFFEVIGIPVYQGWGLTEACPLCTNTPKNHKAGTVGKPLPGQKIKISKKGEILVKGDLVMHGYYKDPEKTAQAISADGFLHTGDKGKLDDEGYLTIVGRLKEVYKSSTGESITPGPIEHALCANPLVDMAVVIGEGKRFASCLLFPNLEVLQRLKNEQNSNLSDSEFLSSEYVRQEIDEHLTEVNNHLNHPEQIRAYRFVLDPLTIAGGDLTPSMKIKRDQVIKKYSNLIDDIYQESGGTHE